MRLIIVRDELIEEIAAEPETLDRLAALLTRVAVVPPGPAVGTAPSLLGLPMVPDPTIPPLTVLLRPYSAPALAPEERP